MPCKKKNLKVGHSKKNALLPTTNFHGQTSQSFLFLFPCLLFRFHFVCSFFLRFDLFSLFFVVFCCFFLRFVACFLVCPCFCSLLLFFCFFFSFVLLLFSASVRAFLFPSVCFFFAPLVPFSPLSFFLSPVSLALLLPPLLVGLFPPEIAVNMAQVPAKTGWAMWNRLRGTGDWHEVDRRRKPFVEAWKPPLIECNVLKFSNFGRSLPSSVGRAQGP